MSSPVTNAGNFHRVADARDVECAVAPELLTSASENSRAVVKRSIGALASARITAESTAGGTVSRSTRNDVGRSVINFAIIA